MQFFLQLLYSYEETDLRTKLKCNYTFITYFSTLINKSVIQVEEGMLEIYLPSKQKWDRHNITSIQLAIFQNYQHQPCLFSLLVTEQKNGNERNSQNQINHWRIQCKRNPSGRRFPLPHQTDIILRGAFGRWICTEIQWQLGFRGSIQDITEILASIPE